MTFGIPGATTSSRSAGMTDLDKSKEQLVEELRELRKSEQLHRTSFEQSPACMGRAGLDGVLLDVNPTFCAWLGYQRRELIGKHTHEITHPDDLGVTVTQLDKMGASGSRFVTEKCYLHRDGSAVWARLDGATICNATGAPSHIEFVLHDITVRKQAEAEQQQLTHDLGERVKELQCVYGVAESIRVRDTMADVFADVVALIPTGWNYPELTRGRICFDGSEFVAEPFEPTQWRQTAPLVIDGETRGSVEVYYLKQRPELDEGPFLREERDLIDGIARALSEGIEHNEAQEAVRQSEQRFRSLIEGVGLPIFTVAQDGTFLVMNDVAAAQLGGEPVDFLGKSMWDLFPKDIANRQMQSIQAAIDSGASVSRESETAIRGELRFFITHITPIMNSDGSTTSAFGVAHDITDRKRIEAQLMQAQKMEAIGTLAGGIAHDMNNVLAVVLGIASVLEHEIGSDDPKADDIQEIMSAARRGKSLVENLLGFARKGNYQRQMVSLNDTVRGLVEMLGHSLAKKVVINTVLDEQLMAVECDAGQIMQTLMNVCLNASDALDGRGTITITTRNEVLEPGDATELAAGRYVAILVEDNGPGMDDATRKRAFEPFFTTKDVGKGTGLGLSMVYGVTENHGGTVTINSVVGEGTIVSILLPAAGRQDTVDRVDSSTTSPLPRVRPGKARILLVDDEDMLLRSCQRILQVNGYDVDIASGGHAALDIFRDQHAQIDLVLLDLSMPIMDGVECFDELRKIDAGVRVLVCTGHGSPSATEEIIGHGALGVVTKPFDLNELSDAIATAIGGAGAVAPSH